MPALGRDRPEPRTSATSEDGGGPDALNERREAWLNLPDATAAELKKRTLTTLSNARPTWLANAQAALDRAVCVASGWPADEIPADVAEDVIPSRLLALNGERAAPEATASVA